MVCYRSWAVSRTRLRSRGSPARPNICLLIILMWVDAAFDGSGVPGCGQALGDGAEVLLEAFGEGRYAGQFSGAGVADPLREVLAGELGEHRGERADVAGGDLEFGAAFQQRLELGLLVFGQGIGMAATVGEDFAAEQPFLLPLPPESFDTAAVLWPRVDRYARISVGKCRYSVPARLIDARVRVALSANELRVFAGPGLVAVHPRLIAAGAEHLDLDHYLEILIRKPGALPGSAALAQARAAGTFTAVHQAFRARARLGDGPGTRALIEVLLLHRRLPAAQVSAGIAAALAA